MKYLVIVNEDEVEFNNIKKALDLVEATYSKNDVVFIDYETGLEMSIFSSLEFSELCDMY